MFESILLFLKVIQFGSMSAAGREMNLSPASVSRIIVTLEGELGVQLFNRTSRKIVLTDAGERFLERVKPLMEEFQEARSAAKLTQDEPEGNLQVHSHTSVGVQLIGPLIRDFCELYPKISVNLQLSETPVNLMEESYDVDIRLGELQDSSLLVRKLAPSDRLLVATPAYLKYHAPIKEPRDLLSHNCLTYRPNSQTTTWLLAKTGEEAQEFRVTGNFHCNNADVLRNATLNGMGIALLTNWGTYQDRRNGNLVPVLPEYKATINSFNNGIFAVFKHTRYVPKKIRVFVDFLVERMRTQSDSDRFS